MDAGHEESRHPGATLLAVGRPLTFDEFKTLYQQQKKADMEHPGQSRSVNPWLREMRQRRNRMLGTNQEGSGEGQATPEPTWLPPMIIPHTEQEADHHHHPDPPARPDTSVMTSIQRACTAATLWVLRIIQQHWFVLLQISVSSVAMFGSWSWKNLAFTCVIFVVLRTAKWVLTGLQVEHPGRAVNDGPTPLGRMVWRLAARHTPPGQIAPVSTPLKLCYMAAKCAETFILSLWPNYSVESLEAQLQRDGIVRDRPAAPVAADGAPANAPVDAAGPLPEAAGEDVAPAAPVLTRLEELE